jgi:hypothetical protein
MSNPQDIHIRFDREVGEFILAGDLTSESIQCDTTIDGSEFTWPIQREPDEQTGRR